MPAFAQEVDDGDSNGKGQASWSVQDPPGEWRPITIDADEVSWSSVDVSPDGKFLVFDFLGDLYRLPIDGGDAWQAETHERFERQAQALGWRHEH